MKKDRETDGQQVEGMREVTFFFFFFSFYLDPLTN